MLKYIKNKMPWVLVRKVFYWIYVITYFAMSCGIVWFLFMCLFGAPPDEAAVATVIVAFIFLYVWIYEERRVIRNKKRMLEDK